MSPYPLFRDRIDAGEQLAQAIHAILLRRRLMEFALPVVLRCHEGLPVAAPVAPTKLPGYCGEKVNQKPELGGAVTSLDTSSGLRKHHFADKIPVSGKQRSLKPST